MPSLLANSPPGRSSTLPPLHRPSGPTRPRKQSVTKRGREAHHKKKNSRGSAADWLKRIQNEERMRPGSNDRNALSLEPTADYGKRWEDLIDAADQAASAAGDIDEDRTPVSTAEFEMIWSGRANWPRRCHNHLCHSTGHLYPPSINSNFSQAVTKHRRCSKLSRHRPTIRIQLIRSHLWRAVTRVVRIFICDLAGCPTLLPAGVRRIRRSTARLVKVFRF